MRAEFETDDIDLISDAVFQKIIDHLEPAMRVQAIGRDDLLTIEELSDLIKVKPRQIYAWVNESKHIEGGIPFLKAGKFLRFPRHAVLEWMQPKNKEPNRDGKEVTTNARRNSKERKQLLRISVDRRKEEVVFRGRSLQTQGRNDPE
ncbi:MAG: Helix-turn-helix domain protein [Syntrophorhabdus sp. PtaU1.Bin002]|nr:MAG: Helix-turn-helix domain protein [Syntrophorhabdus sp. PtaB.Bin006]OPY67019.1 MAG: Helix-turn-helix domain protein [Syntrophorhabdus sp. PtaU1.Bin002]